MEAWKRMNKIRETLSDETIVEALVQYMSEDDLNDFCEELEKDYDLDYDEE